MNSDNAAVLLQARDFVRGNYLLRGWTISNYSVYTTELPYYVIGLLVAGFTPSLLCIIPALLFIILAVLSASLIYCETRSRAPLSAMAVTFVLLGLPWGFSAWLLLAAVQHIGTMIMLLGALICLSLIGRQPRGPWLFLWFLTFLTCAVLDDEFAIYVGILPIVGVLVLRLLFGLSRIRKDEIALAVLGTASVPLGMGIAHLIYLSGGFVTLPPHPALAAPSAIAHNAWLAFRGIFLLFGANPFVYRLWSLSAASALIHLTGIAVVAIGIWRILVRWMKRDDDADLVPQILVAGIAIDIGCYLISDMAVNLATTRYLTPTLIYGALVAGIALPSSAIAGSRRWLAGAVAAVYVATFAAGMFAPPTNQDELAVASWLRQHGLIEGYGDYWAAGILTVESRDSIKVRQVAVSDTGYHPFQWNSNERWYRDAKHGGGFNFLVLDGSDIAGVSEASALKFFGKPAEQHQIAGYRILVWNKKLPVRP